MMMVRSSGSKKKRRGKAAGGQGFGGRATKDDVDRISYGKRAKKRGTGSRGVCHRLNESERTAFELAKTKGFVVLRGAGYRRERKGSPLANIWRQWCDAKAMPCISIVTGLGQLGQQDLAVDQVRVDFSTLRLSEDNDAELPKLVAMGEWVVVIASELGLQPKEENDMWPLPGGQELEGEEGDAGEIEEAVVAALAGGQAAEGEAADIEEAILAAPEGGKAVERDAGNIEDAVLAGDGAEEAETKAETKAEAQTEAEAAEAEWDALLAEWAEEDTAAVDADAIWKLPEQALVFDVESRKEGKALAGSLAGSWKAFEKDVLRKVTSFVTPKQQTQGSED